MTYEQLRKSRDNKKAFMKEVNDNLSAGKSFTIRFNITQASNIAMHTVCFKVTPKECFAEADYLDPCGLWHVLVGNTQMCIHPSYPCHDGLVLETDTHIEIPITPKNISWL